LLDPAIELVDALAALPHQDVQPTNMALSILQFAT
jgi:hypothetical protein